MLGITFHSATYFRYAHNAESYETGELKASNIIRLKTNSNDGIVQMSISPGAHKLSSC